MHTILSGLLSVVAATTPPVASAPQVSDDHFARFVDASGAHAARMVSHWGGRAAVGNAPRPGSFDLEGTRQYQNLSPSEMEAMRGRILAMSDHLLGQPALRDSRIQAEIKEASAYRFRGQLQLVFRVEVTLGPEWASAWFNTPDGIGPDREFMTVGQTPGGCQRQVHQRKPSIGEAYRVASDVGDIRDLFIADASPTMANRHYEFQEEANTLEGRMIAAVQTMDCRRLLEIANGG